MRTLIRLSVCALMLGSMGTLHLSPVQSALAAPTDAQKNLSVKSQKEFEKTLTKAIEEEQEELNVTWQGAKKKEISAILKAVKKNNLDIYNIYMDRRGVQISLSIQYHYDKSLIEESSTAQSNKDTLKTISKLIADFKKPGTSDFEKVAGIHDLLVQKFQYAGNNDDVVSVLQQKHGTKEGLTRTAYVLLKKLDDVRDGKYLETYGNRLDEIVEFAKEKGVEPNPEQLAKSKPLLVRLVNAYIVRNILNDEGFFPLFERDDDITQKAIEQLTQSPQ